ncbi:hypothetical protein T440DRAFT_227823 [Plenodomus tracheiphilus IPT5]|uniref:Uncharacterized protein n=1 Tax=Plenodomus tracheiphilus IPT5 TaxID=1408161 RepID=A0A6A7AUS5_9PLEO|nr:hypothetical protein T440DRAFT_227823 [Plenodomus tracheiphilus IPT5]
MIRSSMHRCRPQKYTDAPSFAWLSCPSRRITNTELMNWKLIPSLRGHIFLFVVTCMLHES